MRGLRQKAGESVRIKQRIADYPLTKRRCLNFEVKLINGLIINLYVKVTAAVLSRSPPPPPCHKDLNVKISRVYFYFKNSEKLRLYSCSVKQCLSIDHIHCLIKRMPHLKIKQDVCGREIHKNHIT